MRLTELTVFSKICFVESCTAHFILIDDKLQLSQFNVAIFLF